jgi:hypothetical protein
MAQAQASRRGGGADHLGGVAGRCLVGATGDHGDRQAQRPHLVAGEPVAQGGCGFQTDVEGGIADPTAVDLQHPVGGEAAQPTLHRSVRHARVHGGEVDRRVELGRRPEQAVQPAEYDGTPGQPLHLEPAQRPGR